MADFDKYAPKLKKWEGGFVNNPADPGGATLWGVTLKTYRNNFGRDKTIDDLKRMTYQEWRMIMKNGYWDKCKGDLIKNQSVAEILADWCVNAGTVAIKRVQWILGVSVDGIIGKKTIAALNNMDQRYLHYTIKEARVKYYKDLAEKKSQLSIFLNGWLNRTDYFKYSE